MASRYIVPQSGSADWGSTNTWSATPYGAAGAAVPAAADDVYLHRGAAVINGGLNQATVNLSSLTISPDFVGAVGTGGTSLTIGVVNTAVTTTDQTVRISSRGANVYLAAGTDGIDKVLVESPGVNVRLTGGTTKRLNAFAGDVSVDPSGVVQNAQNAGATLTLNTSATACTSVVQVAGFTRDERGATTVSMSGGEYAARREAAQTTVNMSGGLFMHQSAGTLGTLNMYAGTYNPQGAPVNPTITTVNLFGQSGTTRFINQAGLVSVTIGTLNNNSLGSEQTVFSGGGNPGLGA